PALGNIVFFPQVPGAQLTPDLFTADPALRTVFGATANDVQNGSGAAYAPPTGAPAAPPIVAASPFDLPDLSTPYIAGLPAGAAAPIAQAEALTRSLATMAVINEYLTDTSISAATDWVFSMPTRRYSVAADYRGTSATGRAFTSFVDRHYFTAANTTLSGNQICTATTGVTVFNREEATAQGTNFVISPNPPVAQFSLCGEASVLAFNGSGPATAVLGAEIAKTDFPAAFRDGWARVGTPGVATGLAPSIGGNGLPILGKAFVRAAPGAGVGFFGASWEHRYVRPATP
ncbi:MAG: cell surface protein, partial [Ramlibacter sp.]